MPITEESRYAAVSTVLYKHQVERRDAIHRKREAELGGKLRKAEVDREIFEAGLVALSQGAGSISSTSRSKDVA